MIAEAQQYLRSQNWWMAVFRGLVITFAVPER